MYNIPVGADEGLSRNNEHTDTFRVIFMAYIPLHVLIQYRASIVGKYPDIILNDRTNDI